MSAQMQLRVLGHEDIDSILAIENRVYFHPWTRGNFEDTMMNPHAAFGFNLANTQGVDTLAGYYLVVPIVDEFHLMTIAVDLIHQKKGYARAMLEHLAEFAMSQTMSSILLEVRKSNLAAIRVYEKSGYELIGVRKGYYPAESGAREDALVMRRTLLPLI